MSPESVDGSQTLEVERVVRDVLRRSEIFEGSNEAIAIAAAARVVTFPMAFDPAAPEHGTVTREDVLRACLVAGQAIVSFRKRRTKDAGPKLLTALRREMIKRIRSRAEIATSADIYCRLITQLILDSVGSPGERPTEPQAAVLFIFPALCALACLAPRGETNPVGDELLRTAAEPTGDTDGVGALASAFLTENRQGLIEGLESAAAAVADGRSVDADAVERVLEWSSRLSELHVALGGAPADPTSTAGIEELLELRHRAADPRVAMLAELEGLTTTNDTFAVAVKAIGDTASRALATLDEEPSALAGLTALHALIVTPGDQAVLNANLGHAMALVTSLGIEPAAFLPPGVEDLQLGDASARTHPASSVREPSGAPVAATADDDESVAPAPTRAREPAPTPELPPECEPPHLPKPDGGPRAVVPEDGRSVGGSEASEDFEDFATVDAPEPSVGDGAAPRSSRDNAPPEQPDSPDESSPAPNLQGVRRADVDGSAEPSIETAPSDPLPPALKSRLVGSAGRARTSAADLDAAITTALTSRRTSAAYWLSTVPCEGNSEFTTEALRMTAMAAKLTSERGELPDRLAVELQLAISTEHSVTSEVLYAAAALHVLPMRPFGSATTVLHEASRDLSRFSNELATACEEMAHAASAGAFAGAREASRMSVSSSLAARREEMRARAEEGLERWPHETHQYTPVRWIWTRWSHGSGALLRILELVSRGSEDVEQIEHLLADFATRKALARSIDQTFRQLNSKARLEASARRWLEDRVERVVKVATEWAELVREGVADEGPSGGVDHESRLARLEKDLDSSLHQLSTSGSASLAAVLPFFRDGWQQSIDALRGRVRSNPNAVEITAEALNEDLVAAWEIGVDGGLAPSETPPELLLDALGSVHERSWRDVFEHRFSEGNHAASAFALRKLDGEQDAAALRDRREEDVASRRRRLDGRLNHLRVRLSRLHGCGVLTSQRFEELQASIVGLSARQVLAFPSVDEQIDRITAEGDAAAESRRRELMTRLTDVTVQADVGAQITSLLDQEQFEVAEEIVGQLERGESVDLEGPRADLLQRFLDVTASLDSTVSAVRALDALESTAETETALKTVKLAITTLSRLKEPGLGNNVVQPALRTIFSVLGLDVVGATVKQRRGMTKFSAMEFEATPVGASWVPPEFQSSVMVSEREDPRCRYTVFVARGAVTERELVSVVEGERASARAVIVLGVEPLTLAKRQSLARAARAQGGTFLLADAFSLLFQAVLASERSDQSPFDAWLASSLPFASINPYVTVGNVPEEMFFGRSEELAALINPSGSNFVFGGRQLGKSALLRTVRGLSHDPSAGRIGILIDLKMEGIGAARPNEAIWPVISRHLDRNGVGADSDPTDGQSVVARVREWLESDSKRSLVLLLDETDEFLEHEAESLRFGNLLLLRGLMEETDRRFKVVLAGLHSVNRFRRIPNQPLVQFGGNAPIGPLSWADARELVNVPMRTAGFRFDPPELVDRILTESRRHPSILQFVCRALIDHFGTASAQRNARIPILISAQQLDSVFERDDLRERIRERFEWTLNLDRRYRVVALITALRAAEEPSTAALGVTTRELWTQCRDLWSKGFASLARDQFDVLLDEMVNLEVLARTTDGRYRLPSISVTRLLGDEEAIYEALEHEVDHEPTAGLRPERIRRAGAWSSATDVDRSPLTLGDENRLLEMGGDAPPVRVVFGTMGLQVNRVLEALGVASEEQQFQSWRFNRLRSVDLESIAADAARAGPPTVRAGLWRVEDPKRELRALRRYVTRVSDAGRRDLSALVLVLDHRSLAHWPAIYEELEVALASNVRWLRLKTWGVDAVGSWLEELEIPNTGPRDRDRVLARTGGWPVLLHPFVEELRRRACSHEDALAAVVGDTNENLEALLNQLGLIDLSRPEIVETMIELGDGFDVATITELVDDVEAGEVQNWFDRLELSGALKLGSDRTGALDPVVRVALERLRE